MAQIRLAGPQDAGAVRAIYAPVVEETPVSFEIDPPSEAEMVRRIEATTASHPWLICIIEDEVVGYAYASEFSGRPGYKWTVEGSVYVHGDHRDRGIGRALYESLLAVLPRQDFVEAYAIIVLPNEPSVRLHESTGFSHQVTLPGVGYKFGAWHDVGWWRRSLRERPHDPDPPLSIGESETKPWWEEAIAVGEDALVGR